MSTVELHGVYKAFGPVPALRGVDLVMPAGELTAVVGPSGCGKTTMLRLISGLDAPDRGQLSIGGEVMAGNGRWTPPERRGVGLLFQQLALFPHLDVAGNVGYGLRRLHRSARRARVEELLEVVGLSGYEHRYPDQLSGGQAQRVALARALAPRPTVMLLDEPFSSLDVGLKAELRAEVRRILEAEGVTTVLVTHDQEEALSLGDQAVVMLEGRVAQAGSPDVVYRRPASLAVAAFLGEPNLLPGEVRDGWMRTELGDLEVGGPDGPALAVVHPEDLELLQVEAGPARAVEVQYYGHDQVVTLALPSGTRVRSRLSAQRRLAVGTAVAAVVRSTRVATFPLAAPTAPAGEVGVVTVSHPTT